MPPTNLLVIAMRGDVPVPYITTMPIADLSPKLDSFVAFVFELTAAPSQTENPWRGTLLNEVRSTSIRSRFRKALKDAEFYLSELPKPEQEALVTQAVVEFTSIIEDKTIRASD
jgi:hypothetical protein